MTNAKVYTHKAEAYARYRWDYAPEAIETLIQRTGAGAHTCLADIGAGTGILTRHFVGKVARIYAVEINDEMRREAAKILQDDPNCILLSACAEATTLPPAVVDLITVAQAIHWFEPQATRAEFRRILKPGGWLALLRNYGTDPEPGHALNAITTEEYGFNTAGMAAPPYPTPPGFYYSTEQFERLTFPFAYREDWEHFFGALCSASYAPDPDHPAFPQLEQAAHQIFNRFSQDGWLEVHGETELVIGQPE